MGLRKLTVTSFEQKASGHSKNGPWTLHEVACVDEAGEPVEAKLKTFLHPEGDQLIGNLIEYEVERQDDEKYGTIPAAAAGSRTPSMTSARA